MRSFLGLVIPLPAEARALLGRQGWLREDGWSCRQATLPGGKRVLAVCAGQGRARAQQAAAWLAARGATALAVVGVAGGLHPNLQPGDLVLFMENGESLIGNREGMLVRFRPGRFAEVGEPVLTTADKQALFEKSGALAVDLESAAAGRVARQAGLPFFALRAICDPAGRDVPTEFLQCLNEAGQVRAAVLLRVLLRRPGLFRDLLRLRRDFAAALTSLQRQWQAIAAAAMGGWRFAEPGTEPFSSAPPSPPD